MQCAIERQKNEWVDLAQCIRSLSLPMYLIQPSLQPPKFSTRLRLVAAQKYPYFQPKTPEPLRPSPIVGVGEPKALPAPNCRSHDELWYD